MSGLSVMLVDDHFVVRSGLAASLELEDDIVVVAEAETGESALEIFLAMKVKPSVVLMDLQLPGISGIEATRMLCELEPQVRVLIFSTFARDDEVQSALDAGATGYLQKSAGRNDLIAALHSVAEGRLCLPPEVQQRLSELGNGPSVTSREREILALIAKGRANKEIGGELGIAEDTVKRHVSNVLQKLGVSDRAQATAEAIRRGIVSVE